LADYDFSALGEASVSVSRGGQLDGVIQVDLSHLAGLSITLNNNSWENTARDNNEGFIDDNDGGQRLDRPETFDGTT